MHFLADRRTPNTPEQQAMLDAMRIKIEARRAAQDASDDYAVYDRDLYEKDKQA